MLPLTGPYVMEVKSVDPDQSVKKHKLILVQTRRIFHKGNGCTSNGNKSDMVIFAFCLILATLKEMNLIPERKWCFIMQQTKWCFLMQQTLFYLMLSITVLSILGPVVQSVVSLSSSLRVISLTVLADSIYNILIFFAEKM